MYILTRSEWIKNSEGNIYHVQDTELENHYLDIGFRRYERSYTINEQHKKYTVICPEFRSDAETIVIIPEFLVPRRPYAVYVYLYAIDLYSSNPARSQRSVAEETRKMFGLNTFAHTTLCRVLKTFVCNINESSETTNNAKVETTSNEEVKPSGFPTVKATEVLRKEAASYLRCVFVQTELQQAISTCCEMTVKWFMKYHHFLL